MKKFDEKYFKIVKYAVLGVGLSYGAIILMDLLFKIIFDIPNTLGSVFGVFGSVIKIIAPFIFGLVFAYLFDPVVQFFQEKYNIFEENHFKERKEKRLKKLEEKGLIPKYEKRVFGTSILYLIIILILGIIITVVLKGIGANNEENIPISTYILNTISSSSAYLSNMNEVIRQKLISIGISGYFLSIIDVIFEWAKGLTASIVNLIINTAQGIFISFIGLVMGFYILVDKENFKQTTIRIMNVFIPDKANQNILNFFTNMHNIFSGYIRGQLMDATIYGTLVGIALTILGLPYAIFVGVVSGFCNLIPYIGAFVAFTLSVTIGLFSGTPILALYAAVIIIILQQLDSLYIYPKCVSKNIDISPLLVILALSVGGTLFGVVGMLFAVPITSLVKLLLGEFIDRQEVKGTIKKFFSRKDEV